MFAESGLVLLSDQPVGQDGQRDLLSRSAAARQLADLIRASRTAAPFTLAVYADWGMGKSSLLSQVEAQFEGTPDVRTVWFNAWTADRGDALETLIKSVLGQLDPSALRRLARRFGGDTRLGAWAKVAVHGLAGTVRLHHLVDGIWKQLEVDARARNEARDQLSRVLREWTKGDGRNPAGRMIVVFVDDLDRCAPEVIRAVCDAVKQYLSVPGLVFVLGCDQSVIEASVADPGHAPGTIGRRYLEKIVQASYSIPVPTDEDAAALVQGYAAQSGTEALFQGAVAEAVTRHASRNPRRIKRLINRFVIEYRLDEQWQVFGPDALIRVILLQDFYPEFYALLARIEDVDPIDEFTEYLRVRELVGNATIEVESDRDLVKQFLDQHGVPEHVLHDLRTEHMELVQELLSSAERELPPPYVMLARDKTFVGLVGELAEAAKDEVFRAKLRRRRAVIAIAGHPSDSSGAQDPSGSEYVSGAVYESSHVGDEDKRTDLTGMRILWIFSRGPSDVRTGPVIEHLGARITWVEDGDAALRVLATGAPDAVIGNLWREEDRDGGFADLARLRTEGYYERPIIVYTGFVSPARRERAADLLARITDRADELVSWLGSIAGQPGVLLNVLMVNTSSAATFEASLIADVITAADLDTALRRLSNTRVDVVVCVQQPDRPVSSGDIRELKSEFHGPVCVYSEAGDSRSGEVETRSPGTDRVTGKDAFRFWLLGRAMDLHRWPMAGRRKYPMDITRSD